jgi:small subunit ribosomal protein S8
MMSITDPLADMLTRVRNAGNAKLNSVDIPGSKTKAALANVLKEEGYIRNFKFIKDNKQGIIRIYLKYDKNDRHAIYGLERISKPSRRVYVKGKDAKPVLNGIGVAVLSTSRGILTDKQARQENLGGELLCKIW